ncbi:nucleoside deaminase [Chitinophaga sp. GCM10012297]|uniref:Nucleoside deaminase n=1 Tax=Chitinophaga chungangae TaxID=2821488 RepID=A0ABS3YKK6_9BACT|nr:nucleoside deaminase [Chitinophaga chungangae]MBO9155223.1 nucleoside deaminase [Chitinophaga chungangae]
MNEHQPYMERCMELAAIAQSEGESPVGCVIVQNGVVIGEGIEQSKKYGDISRHAEVMAVLDALGKGFQLAGTVLYSNVEPCMLCSYVIRHHRIGTVVYSTPCGELGGTNPKFNLLTTKEIAAWESAPEVIVV